MILKAIIAAIVFGVHLMRSHSRPDPLTSDEVDALLTKAAPSVPEATNYRGSIVDLMKVLRLDSSLSARKQLAVELGVTGYTGTAEQNEALHRLVMNQVAAGEIGP